MDDDSPEVSAPKAPWRGIDLDDADLAFLASLSPETRALFEANFDEEKHQRDEKGRWTDTGGSKHAVEWMQPVDKDGRPIPIKVKTVEEAIPLVLDGKVVEMTDIRQVNTLIDKLAVMAREAEKAGTKAPNYDLCNVSVAGTNLFCVDEDTEILTRFGWRHHSECRVGDDVLTLNHETGKSEWQPLKAVNVFPAEPRLVLVMEGMQHSSVSTLDHRWPVVRPRGRQHLISREWETSASLYAAGYERSIPTAASCVNLPTKPTVTDDVVALVAWTWTEGNVDSNTIRIYQSYRKNAKNCAEIEARLRAQFGPAFVGSFAGIRAAKRTRLGVVRASTPAWNERRNHGTGMSTYFLNKAASAVVLACLGPQKVVTGEFVSALTLDQLRLFINTSVSADGCVTKKGLTSFSQRVEARSRMFEMACALAGIMPSTSSRIDARRIEIKRQFSTTVSKRAFIVPHRAANNRKAKTRFEMRIDVHEGRVWCPTTANGTWLARRRGTVYYTGNCADRLRSKDFPAGVPRIEMPQLAGEPVPGTAASRLPFSYGNEVNGGEKFIEFMGGLGYKTEAQSVLAASLKASQAELVGQKVAGIMKAAATNRTIIDSPIFVSKDGYIVDGHHRWAAVVGLDTASGKFTTKMNIFRVDAPITEVLKLAHFWSERFGIKQAPGVRKPKK